MKKIWKIKNIKNELLLSQNLNLRAGGNYEPNNIKQFNSRYKPIFQLINQSTIQYINLSINQSIIYSAKNQNSNLKLIPPSNQPSDNNITNNQLSTHQMN